MNWLANTFCTAFEDTQCIASGELNDVALIAKTAVDRGSGSLTPMPVLIFADATGEVIELDWRGTAKEFAARLVLSVPDASSATDAQAQSGVDAEPDASAESPRGRGRPRLGVIAREVTLLPRHWTWLGTQPGGASVALRKLVEVARRSFEVKDKVRLARAVGYKFMSTMAGHEPGFEEASRALFAGDQVRFEALISRWPVDVQMHLKKILVDGFLA